MIECVRESGGLVSMRSLPDGGEAPYEVNCTYFDSMSRTLQGADDLKVDRFICSQTIPMSLEGIPAFYIHALLATPNDHDAVARRGMNRAINRHRWDYPALCERLQDAQTEQSQVLSALSDRLRLRAQQPAFHPNATQFTLQLDDRVFALWRQSLDRAQSIFALHNVSADGVILPPGALNLIEGEDWQDLLSGEGVTWDEEITLAPYQCRWISNRA